MKITDLNTMLAVYNRENQMMQLTIQGYTESISELNSQLEFKKKEFMDVYYNNNLMIQKEIEYKNDIQK